MRAAAQTLQDEKDMAKKEDAWMDFVMAAGTFYAALEQGAKGNNKSTPWFGKKKRERKTDALLSYLHHARNSEQHGLDPITRRNSSNLTLGPNAAVKLRGNVNGNTWDVVEKQGDVSFASDVVALIRVHDDRFGD